MAVNTCQHCQRSFVCDRRDRRFCQSSCRWANSKERPKVPPMPSEAMLSLGLALKSAAPTGAAGYRLGLKTARVTHWFPGQARRSRRWDGSFSTRPYFVLTDKDFEPPRVPKATTYIIHFIGMHGEILPTPEVFRNGITVVEASRMSWPGTHKVRETSDGRVGAVVEFGAGRSPASAKVRPALGGRAG